MATASEIKKRLKGVSEIELRSVASFIVSGRGSLYSTLLFFYQSNGIVINFLLIFIFFSINMLTWRPVILLLC